MVTVLMVWVANICLAESAEEEPFTYDDRGRRDPLASVVSPGGVIINLDSNYSITDLSLEGIMIGKDGYNVAIINGRVLSVKDNIGDFVVNKIKSSEVILIKNNAEFRLRLKTEE